MKIERFFSRRYNRHQKIMTDSQVIPRIAGPAKLAQRLEASLAGPLIYFPLLAAVLGLLPRLLSPQFGLMDDGNSLATARELLQGSWEPLVNDVTGRFRPVYWLSFTLIYWLAGPEPLAFFIGNLVLLLGAVAALMGLIRLGGGSRTHAWSAGLFFAVSGPAVESYYTLGKSEPFQVLFILLSMIFAILAARRRSLPGKAGIVVVSALCLLLPLLSKETTLVMLGVSLGWLVLGLVFRKRLSGFGQPVLAGLAAYMISNILAVSLYFGLRSLFTSGAIRASTYTGGYAFDLGLITAQVVRWAGWLLHDFPYFFVLLAYLVLLVIFRKQIPGAFFVLGSLVWTAAWIGVFLPWVHMVEYYMLPFSVGCAALSGFVVERLLEEVSTTNRLRQAAAWGTAGLAGLFLLIPTINNVDNARLQLSVDEANAEMLATAAAELPEGGLLVLNVPRENEYWRQSELLLEHIYGRQDVRVEPFRSQVGDSGGVESPYLLAVPYIENQFPLSVRLGVYEQGTRDWAAALEGFLPADDVPEYTPSRSFRLFHIDYLHAFCPLMSERGFCAEASPLLDRSVLSYGWEMTWVEAKPPVSEEN